MDVIYIQFYLLFELQYSVNIKDLQVAIAQGFHLFPFRTEKLSLVTPMVLRISGRVGSRRFTEKSSVTEMFRRIFCLYTFFRECCLFHNHGSADILGCFHYLDKFLSLSYEIR